MVSFYECEQDYIGDDMRLSAGCRNISVITGGKAVLNCRVYNIGNRTVSGNSLDS